MSKADQDELALIMSLLMWRRMVLRIDNEALTAVVQNRLGDVQVIHLQWWKFGWLMVNGYISRTFTFGRWSYYSIPMKVRNRLEGVA